MTSVYVVEYFGDGYLGDETNMVNSVHATKESAIAFVTREKQRWPYEYLDTPEDIEPKHMTQWEDMAPFHSILRVFNITRPFNPYWRITEFVLA